MYVVVEHATSQALWQAIEFAFRSTSQAQSLTLLNHLQSLHQGDSTIIKYLGKDKVIIEQLAKANQPIGFDE